jgi:hypothetical protein
MPTMVSHFGVKRHPNKTRTAWDVKHARIRPRFGKLHHFVENARIRDDFHRRVGLGLTAELLLKQRQIIACFVI